MTSLPLSPSARTRPRARASLVIALGLCLFGGDAAAQSSPQGEPAESRASDAIEVTFAGFQRLPNRRFRVFVQLRGQPALTVSQQGKEQVFVLANSHIALRNNKNPLDTQFMDTPLERARLVEGADGVELQLTFKTAVATEHRFVERRGGKVTFSVEFGDAPAGG